MKQIVGRVQHYAWGSPHAIPSILGTEPTGEPQAEYWLGAHEAAPSLVGDDSLIDLIAADPEILGRRSLDLFGARLPFLMKILAAEQPLSLQAHPDREQAQEGFERENLEGIALDARERTYKDDWPKPECIIALSEFDGLCGFREPHETLDLFDALHVPHELLSILNPLGSRRGAAGVAEVFLDLLSLGDERRDLVNEVVALAVHHLKDDGPLGLFATTAVELDGAFPGDKGILGALLLNRFTLRPGEGIFLPPGNMHAYLRGVGIEVMANSDNVLRGGLTAKHIDVDELVKVVDFTPGHVAAARCVEESPGAWQYEVPAPEFAVWRLEVAGLPVAVPATALVRILLVTSGALRLTGPGGNLDLTQGDSALLVAGERVSVDGTGTAFVSSPGVLSTESEGLT